MKEVISIQHDKWLLKAAKSLEFFRPFTETELEKLLNLSEISKYGFRDYIVEEATEGYSFYVILKGTAHIIKRDSRNNRREISELAEGDCFGEMAILLDKERTASVTAGYDCYALEINGHQIEKLEMETQMKLFREFAFMLAKRLKRSSMR